MITKNDLEQAIAECNGVRNPNANVCLKLASYYTILDHMEKDTVKPMYSFANQNYTSDSEFGKTVENLDYKKVMSVMDELMVAVKMVSPNLYTATIRKLTALQ